MIFFSLVSLRLCRSSCFSSFSPLRSVRSPSAGVRTSSCVHVTRDNYTHDDDAYLSANNADHESPEREHLLFLGICLYIFVRLAAAAFRQKTTWRFIIINSSGRNCRFERVVLYSVVAAGLWLLSRDAPHGRIRRSKPLKLCTDCSAGLDSFPVETKRFRYALIGRTGFHRRLTRVEWNIYYSTLV